LLNHGFPALGRHVVRSSQRAIVTVSAALLIGGTAPSILAAPAAQPPVTIEREQNVSWLSPDQAAALNVGIEVLVPSWVPAPFDTVAPSISASGGYYEVYWMIPGQPSTFLQIEAIAGGQFPSGSPADLNIELTVNDSVQGWQAIHDVGIPQGSATPIYDRVWWIANGVLYSVNSWNMTGSDTMSLANSLIPLQVPAAPVAEEPVAEVPVEQPMSPPTDASGGTGPVVEDVPVVTDTSTSQTTQETSAPVTDAQDSGSVTTSDSTTSDVTSAPETGDTGSGEAGNGDLPSDGTDGPRPPVTGSDGTGGARDLALPRIP
jgi:hypothetical protein